MNFRGSTDKHTDVLNRVKFCKISKIRAYLQWFFYHSQEFSHFLRSPAISVSKFDPLPKRCRGPTCLCAQKQPPITIFHLKLAFPIFSGANQDYTIMFCIAIWHGGFSTPCFFTHTIRLCILAYYLYFSVFYTKCQDKLHSLVPFKQTVCLHKILTIPFKT